MMNKQCPKPQLCPVTKYFLMQFLAFYKTHETLHTGWGRKLDGRPWKRNFSRTLKRILFRGLVSIIDLCAIRRE